MAHKVERDALAAEVARLDAGWHKANGDTLDAALERDALMEKVDALTIAAKPALAAMNSINVNCENFHHRKKDQHEPGAECKPRLRYLVAFSALEKAIAAQGNV
jgi:hypothetical protein